MSNPVNVDFITKVVEVEVNDTQRESLAAAAAIASAGKATEKASAAAKSATDADAVATALTDIYSEAIDQGTIVAPAVDATLVIAGAAADAKKTGDNFKSFYAYAYATEMTNNDDFNDFTTAGTFYFKAATTLVNAPASGVLGTLIVKRLGTSSIWQTVITGANEVYTRRKHSGSWSDWKNISINTVLTSSDTYGLSDIKSYINTVDFNDLGYGAYIWRASDVSTLTNCPSADGGTMICWKLGSSGSFQYVFDRDSKVFVRFKEAYNSASWSDWQEFVHQSDIDSVNALINRYNLVTVTTDDYLNTVDFDDMTTYGAYCWRSSDASTLTNCPTNTGGTLIVSRVATGAILQEVWDRNFKGYARFKDSTTGSTWSDWKEIVFKDYVDSAIESVIGRLNVTPALSAKIETVLEYNRTTNNTNILYITDTHLDLGNADEAIKLYNSISSKRIMDACVHGGDMVHAATDDFSEYTEIVLNGLQRFRGVNPNVRFVKGNHDICYGENKASISQMHLLFDSELKDVVFNANAPNKCYFYEDITQKKVRIVYLDSYSIEYNSGSVSFDSDQVSWLYSTALNVPDGWTVLVFSHMFADSGTGAYADVTNILKAFNDRGTTYGGYTFTNDKTTHLVGVIHGHSHADSSSNTTGFNIIGVIHGGIYTNYGFSVFTIDTTQKKLYETRIGTGSDREYAFD